MQKIGVVGITHQAALVFLNSLYKEFETLLGKYNYIPLIFSMGSFSNFLDSKEDRELKWFELFRKKVIELEIAGADFVVCPANSMHVVLTPELITQLPLPIIHILDPVIDKAVDLKLSSLLLLGTSITASSNIYQIKALESGLRIFNPPKPEQIELDRIIIEELINGQVTSRSVNFITELIQSHKKIQAVILGCTELCLIETELEERSQNALLFLDSNALLARATALRAIA